jgi:hypothetical protein
MYITNIFEKRDAGKIRIGFCRVGPIDSVLSTFGLSNEYGETILEVDRPTALVILTGLLLKDMAYGIQLMAPNEANSIADDFFSYFPEDGSRYYTNGRWDNYFVGMSSGYSFVPMTEQTFDGGVIVISEKIAGCIWFEDED